MYSFSYSPRFDKEDAGEVSLGFPTCLNWFYFALFMLFIYLFFKFLFIFSCSLKGGEVWSSRLEISFPPQLFEYIAPLSSGLWCCSWVWHHSFSRSFVWNLTFEPPFWELLKSSLCPGILSLPVVSDSLRPHGLGSTRPLRAWDSPGKNTGVGCHFLLQVLPDPGIEPMSVCLEHCRRFFTCWAIRDARSLSGML